MLEQVPICATDSTVHSKVDDGALMQKDYLLVLYL